MIENCLIVLNYNDYHTTEKLIVDIVNYECFEKIIIVDNCSSDDSYENLKKWESAKIDVIRNEKNRGYAYGNNRGAFYAIKKYNPKILFFANPDVEFAERTVYRMKDILQSVSDYGVVAPLVRNGYNAWEIPDSWIKCMRTLFLLSYTMHKYRIRKMVKNIKIAEVGVVEGSFFAIKKSVFEEVNGFDERTFLYYEENLLAWKLRSLGYKEIIVADIDYYHAHSKSIKKVYKSKAMAFKLFRPSIYVYLKYYLKCNSIQEKLFAGLFLGAYIERFFLDVIKKINWKSV